MSISLIIGKPGSGKSYYAVSRIAEMVREWCAFERREEKSFVRELYTNLYLNVEEFQKYIDSKIGEGIDVSKYIHHLDDDFFYSQSGDGPRIPRKWWEDIPNGSMIVIDEVHQYMPQGGTGQKDYMQLFVEYVSTHRHREHDLYLITQHTDTIHKSILCMAQDIYNIINVKNKVLPYLNIPFADIDVIKEAWGCSRQIANVLYGNYVGRAVKIQNQFTIVLKPEIFALYRSHILTENSGQDRPDLKLGRVGSILWFIRKHIFHLSIKAMLVVLAFKALGFLFTGLPSVMSNAMRKGAQVSIEKPVPASELDTLSESPPDSAKSAPSNRVVEDRPKKEMSFKEERERDFYNVSGVYIYGSDFIVMRDIGRVSVGDTFTYQGEQVKLISVDFKHKKFDFDPVLSNCGSSLPVPEGAGARLEQDSVSSNVRGQGNVTND